MIAKTLYFGSPYQLTTQYQQLVCTSKETGEQRTIPIEDIAIIIIDHVEIYLSIPATQLLLAHNVAIVYCDAKHHPIGLVMPLQAHTLQQERFGAQITAKQPLKKQLWKQTIEAKINNQATLLLRAGYDISPMLHCMRQLKSGDTTNQEAQAARWYWKHIFGAYVPHFRRDRYGGSPNHLLNYGYAILRAATARALVGAGLLPTLGIHHRNRYNAYALADDLMEPYRPWIDMAVLEMLQESVDEEILTRPLKARLLSVLTADMRLGDTTRPMMIALAHTAASLARCFAEGSPKALLYPTLSL